MLFEIELEKDNSPIEDVNITYMQLFYDEQQHKEFKQLCVSGMMKMYPETYREQNASVFILELLKQYNNAR